MGVVFSSVYTVWYDLAGCRTDYGCHLYVDRTTIVRTNDGAERPRFAYGFIWSTALHTVGGLFFKV